MDDARGAGPSSESAVGAVVLVLDHLVGPLEGRRQAFGGGEPVLRIGTAPDVAIRFPESQPAVANHHATLVHDETGYHLASEAGQRVEVNGEPVTARLLASGDTLRLGEGGPVLRFRLHPAGRSFYKSIPEALHDCADGARLGRETWHGRVGHLLRALPRELLRQTSPWTRGAILLLLVTLLLTTARVMERTTLLETELARQAQEVHVITGFMEQLEENALSVDALQEVRDEIEARQAETAERVEDLEAQAVAAQQVIASVTPSVVFLQGSYGFVDAEGDPLRLMVGEDGGAVTDPLGNPMLSTSGSGPVFERFFTGTAFVATEDGLLVTTAHLAAPWGYESPARVLVERGFTPVMHRQLGYLPGLEAPFDVEVALASGEVDLAVLRSDAGVAMSPLAFGDTAPEPGEDVIVLGYPTGLRALLARTSPQAVDSVMADSEQTFWSMARRLAEGGHIQPLATRGIVGQVTSTTVVYDAVTTHGGSGGPVVGLDGEVVAINSAVLGGFAGSNLGVPVSRVPGLLDRVSSPDVDGGS